jgi:type VI secretion system protein ImpF
LLALFFFSPMKLVPNLFERLAADDPANNVGVRFLYSPEQARESVAGDLEALMNSRAAMPPESLRDFPLAQASVLNFGIPDFSSMSLLSGLDRDRLCKGIASAVEQQDGRLRLVSVALDDEQQTIGRLSFTITAVLTLSGVAQSVRFSAEFDQNVRRYVVGRRSARN